MSTPDEPTPGQPEEARAHDPVTGGMVAASPEDRYEREPDADLWGAAGADDIHVGLGDAADLTPDEAARVLFGEEAESVRSAARDEPGDGPNPNGRRPEGESPVD